MENFMKKFTKAAVIALALCLSANVLAACSDNTKDDTDKQKETKATTETTAEETTKADEPEETTTEATEEATEETTEATTEETTVETNNEVKVYTSEDYDKAYDAYMNQIDTINASGDGDYLYGFVWDRTEEAADVPYVLVASKPGDDNVLQYVSVDGEIIDSDSFLFDGPTLTYETIKKLPAIMETFYFSEDTVINDSIKDGLYYGDILAVSVDGTKVLASFGNPVIISAEKYDALQEGDNLGDVTGIDLFSDEYYTLNEYGCFGDDFYFSERDGEYILYGSSDCIISYGGDLAHVDIGTDCKITDNFIWLTGADGFEQELVADSLADTCFLSDMTSEDGMLGQYRINHNGWTEASAILEPVVIENGTIKEITLGWR